MSMSDSDSNRWSAAHYRDNAGFVPELGNPVLELLAPKPGERILDLGCGDGVLTERLKASGAEVIGVDASPELLASARAKGLDVLVMDGQSLGFSVAFDGVFSNAALHWMRRPRDVLAGVVGALKPGGRFVGEFGGHGNVAAVRVAINAVLDRFGIDGSGLNPWYFPTAEAYRALLAESGFAVDFMRLMPRPTPLPTDVRGWLRTFAGAFLNRLAHGDREAAMSQVQDLLRPVLCDEQANWVLDYVRIRFAARLAAGPGAQPRRRRDRS